MPEAPFAKHVLHPSKQTHRDHAHCAHADDPYAELQVTSNFTFLTGASHPEEFVQRAAELGHRGIALTDRNTLAGIVRAHVSAKEIGLPFAVGCRLTLHDESHDAGDPTAAPPLDLLVYATDRPSYGRLCQMLTDGKRRTTKGRCHLTLADIERHHAGLLAVLPAPEPAGLTERFHDLAAQLTRLFAGDDRLSLAITCRYAMDDRQHLARCAMMAAHLGIPLVATNDAHHHTLSRKLLHDVVTCIREGCTLDDAGYLLDANAERHLKPPHEMHRLFAEYPRALARSVSIIERAAAFSLDELRYEYPHETCPPGRTAMEYLTELTWQGAAERYPEGLPAKVRAKLEHELRLIKELNYAHYFLTVHDIVVFARERGILCQGRGAAANSAVCFCLGVTSVDPTQIDLLFERFVSKERDEPPDIDIDFEHERREEVIQYLYARYGRHRAALTAEVVTYRARSAVREVGKVLGLSLDLVDQLARDLFWFDQNVDDPNRFRDVGVDPNDPTICMLGSLSRELLGFPRHLSQHVGGFILTEHSLSETVPIENAAMPDRTVIEWDKDDIEALGMLKVDVLGLGMLTCVRKCFDLLRDTLDSQNDAPASLADIPPDDQTVYDMICNADTVGVFQIESRAQMSMLPRLKPRTFYDLVIEVAIVRPGPIQGGMVHPYLRRRNGEEDVDYPSEAVRKVLQKTLGVPLFQEQAMQLVIKAAGFTPGEADQLRRAMAAWKRKGNLIEKFGRKIITGMLGNGYTREFAERCFEQIKGFSEYGFPESHAASFALIVYVSAWLKCYHPAAFAAALINSQPMGFYQPAQIVRDAKEHGVEVRPIDVQCSKWDCTLERDSGIPSLRLGMRIVKSLRKDDANRIVHALQLHGRFTTIEQLWRASGASVQAMRTLASADAFGSMGLSRQQARWATQRLRDVPMPLFDSQTPQHHERAAIGRDDDEYVVLPAVPASVQVVQDYGSTGLSLKAHPVSFLRDTLDVFHITANAALADEAAWPHGAFIRVAGLVLIRQRPGTASGIVFFTIEDETGIANLIVRPHIFDRYRRAARHSQIIIAEGTVERQGQVIHIMTRAIYTAPHTGTSLRTHTRNFR